MQQLNSLEAKRLVSRLGFVSQMRTQLIGSPKANDFNEKFSNMLTWKADNVTSEMIDGAEDRLRVWMKTNKVTPWTHT